MKQRNEIKKEIVRWLKTVAKAGFDTTCYRFENVGSGFRFAFDGDIYTVINGYFSDGYMARLGGLFEDIMMNTDGWLSDFDSYSVVDFVKDDY